MDEQIRVLKEFIEQNYLPQLLEAARKGHNFLVIDFSELIKFNTELAEELLEDPENLLKAGEVAVKEFDLPRKISKFTLRLSNLPDSQRIKISEIRSKHLNKLIWPEGVVRQKSDVRPHVSSTKFECPSCGNIINILQLDKKYKEPSKCSCGRKGKFKEISRELVDGQGIVLEESSDDLDGGSQPKRINVFLKDDLVAPISERRTGPGSGIKLCGWLSEVPIILRTGGQSTKYDLIIEANYIEPLQDDFIETHISEQELEEIKKVAHAPNVLEVLAHSIAPSIYGHDKIKEALVLQLAGGCRKMRDDGVSTRGDIHILLIGDPGSGKSQLLKRITLVAPKARFTSGKGATAAGLTASVVKDEFLGGWSLEAGTLVLANRGFAVIDEMDKMNKEDRSALHEALEQQQVSISKANIQATLRCETTVLAAANPKLGRFDPYDL
ncbi:MAG: minichromosome maintenance protein MCM, partial [Nanoarchaeota archaeon]